MAENRKEELIASFIGTFCKYGLDGTTTKKLAEDAGISEGGIYVHFQSKEDIILKCVQAHFETVRNKTSELAEESEGYEDFIFGLFDYVKSMLSENRFILQVFGHPHYSELIKGIRSEHLKFGVTYSARGRNDLPEETWNALVSLCNSALNNYVMMQDENSCLMQLNFIISFLKTK